MEGKRRYSRAPLRATVVLVPEAAHAGALGVAKDISIAGMFIATDAPLPFGCALSIRVTLPGQDKELVLPAIVRWARSGEGMGVQFGALGVRETHAIARYIDDQTHFDFEAPTKRPA